MCIHIKKDNDFIRFRTVDKSMVTLFKTNFSKEELKAINMKCEELNWLGDEDV